jgi:hypothetical protein
MFEMRFMSWGLPRSILFLMSVSPILFARIFHDFHSAFLTAGLVLAVFWVFLITRGFYVFSRIYLWLMLSGLSAELVFALRDKNFIQMGAAIVFVLLFLFGYHWLEERIARAQFDPSVQWYEGLPKLYPRVEIEVQWKDQWRRALLRKIDDHGIFLFLQDSEHEAETIRFNRQLKKTGVGLKIRYRDHQFEGDARLQSIFCDRWLGMGLQIQPKDLYHFTQYGKIVQTLKGEGYAI